MPRTLALPTPLLRALAVWCLLQGTVVAMLSPDLLAWDARHEHTVLRQQIGGHTHPWDTHRDPWSHGPTGHAPATDTAFSPSDSGSVTLALPMLARAEAQLPIAPLPVLAAHRAEAPSPQERLVTIDTPPPRSVA